MGEFKRKVNDLIRLKLSLADGATNKFVRATLFDQDGAAVAPGVVALPHQSGGVYAENTVQMPNKDQVVARYEVFKDAGFTVIDKEYTKAVDVFEKDTFDPTNLIPKAQNVFATVSRVGISGQVTSRPEIKATLGPKQIAAKVEHNEVKAQIETQNEIEGVLND